MKIAMTGATGLLGRNVLFELLRAHRGRMDSLRITLLGRPTDGENLQSRIEGMLAEELEEAFGDRLGPFEMARIRAALRYAEVNLEEGEELDGSALLGDRLDAFLHVAAVTDFRSGEEALAKLQRTNVEGSRRLLRLLDGVRVDTLGFVGTAYVAPPGAQRWAPDRIDLEQDFRNHYEQSKAQSESDWRAHAAERGIPLQVFRPSTICGRLLDGQKGQTPKFDVFYGWAGWFLKQKLRLLEQRTASFASPFSTRERIEMRVHVDPGGLNIVPADYAARLIAGSIQRGGSVDVNITADQDVSHADYMSWLLEAVGVEGVRYVSARPSEPSREERGYYRTVGELFGPYVAKPAPGFDCTSRRQLDRELGLQCPTVDAAAFRVLAGYAVDQSFGMNLPARHEAQTQLPPKTSFSPVSWNGLTGLLWCAASVTT